MGVSKVAFPRRLQLQNRDSTGANLSNAIKCRCRVNGRGHCIGGSPGIHAGEDVHYIARVFDVLEMLRAATIDMAELLL
jgi:hypothetical protein